MCKKYNSQQFLHLLREDNILKDHLNVPLISVLLKHEYLQ